MSDATVTINDRTGASRSFNAAAGARILHEGLIAGIGLPHECGTGTCGMCKARLDAGEIDDLWPTAPGRKSCRRKGEILMCQSSARGDVALTLKADFTEPPEPACATVPAVLRVIDRPTADILRLRCNPERSVPFKAGQFVLVDLPGVEGPRAWSMTNYDPQGRQLDLLVRRAPGGVASDFVFGVMPESLEIRVTGPLGRAVFEPKEARPFLAIAGGSGIAGMLSIVARAQGANGFGPDGSDLVFGLRDPSGAYLLDELDGMVREAGGALRVVVAFSDSSEGLNADHWPHLTFAEGFAHDVAAPIVERAKGAAPIHYVAGPPVMVDAALKALLTTQQVAAQDIRYDRFD